MKASVSSMGIKNFKLIPKMEKNLAIIYIVAPNGESTDIMHIKFPADGQVNDNVDAINDIMAILRKRIRRSL